jgi:hypothetical protein
VEVAIAFDPCKPKGAESAALPIVSGCAFEDPRLLTFRGREPPHRRARARKRTTMNNRCDYKRWCLARLGTSKVIIEQENGEVAALV